jgi:hypothetical protein
MRKLAIILSSAMLFSQAAMAKEPYARCGFDKEQVKHEREAKLERDKQYRQEVKDHKGYESNM